VGFGPSPFAPSFPDSFIQQIQAGFCSKLDLDSLVSGRYFERICENLSHYDFFTTEENRIYLCITDAIRMKKGLKFSHLLDRFMARILPLSCALTKSHWFLFFFFFLDTIYIQTGHINNMYDIIQLLLMVHLLVLLMLAGL